MTDLRKMIDCYRGQYGDETDELFNALLRPQEKIALLNPFIKKEHLCSVVGDAPSEALLGTHFYRLRKDIKPQLIDGLMSHYFLDFSSVLPAMLLPIEPHMSVLDMCSAPGGKLLVMISRLINGVKFMANDLSHARSFRLKRVLLEFLPSDFFVANIITTTKDATHFGLKEKSSYGTVLLDAPCSSEAHVATNPELVKKFTGLRKSLPMRQYSLLSAALLALKPGGYLMYSTCSINRNENDGVIKRLLHKKRDMCALQPLSSPMGDQGDFGISILPHRHGAGPAYFSLLRRM